MFNWLGNLFPYSDLHSLNLDWILSKMKETATQAAQAIADSAKALAQVIEAKTAAQNAQTAAQNAQTAANNAQTAANNAADSAENAVAEAQAAKSAAQTAQNTANTAQSAAQTAQSAAQTAQSAAQTAQSTAETAQTAAQTAQSTAETAQTAAQTAQSAAQTAKTAADNALSKFPVKSKDIADGAVTTSKIDDGAVTNRKMSTANFFVGIGSYSLEKTATSNEIAAGQAVFSFPRTSALAVIFVAYNTSNYQVGDATHTLLMYSDPFFLNTISTKRVVDITLGDFNKQTGENTEYKGSLEISVSASRAVTGKITFTEKLPFSEDISIPYGISGLAARPL